MNLIVIPAVAAASFLAFQTTAPADRPPAKDARGIPVVSNPAQAPAGANQPVAQGASAQPAPNQQAVFASRPSSGEYPVCTREVTDGCLQRHERGVPR